MIQTEETLESRPSEPRSGLPKDDEAWRVATPPDGAAEVPELIIKPTTGWIGIDWKEIYNYRELLVFFIWRDVSARYKQTILGPAWAILQPVVMMVIFTFVAGVAGIATPMGLPIPVCVFAALIPWSMFSQGMPAAANSLHSSLNMVTKVYFPRLFLPITAAALFLVDAVITLFLYGGILWYYHVMPQWTIVFVPFLIVLTLIAALSIGVLLSGLTLFYRDFRHIVPFLVQIMMYVTPIFYSIQNIPAKYHWGLSFINPMFGITDAFRACILGTPLYWDCLLISSVTSVALLIFAVFYFRRTERMFADYV